MWIVISVVLFVLLLLFFRPHKKQTANPGIALKPAVEPAYHWDDPDDLCEVVGESHYQAALKQIVQSGASSQLVACLIPESSNPADKNAVRVEIHGKTVGYLSRDDAPDFRAKLSAKRLGKKVTSCGAVITGGNTGRDGRQYSYGVQLSLNIADE